MINAIDTVRADAEFRAYLATIRLEEEPSTRTRVAHRVCLMGFGAIPCRQAVAELVKLDLLRLAEKWCTMYAEFSNDNSVVLADLLPVVTEPKVKIRTPKFTYRGIDEPFVGILKIQQLRKTRYAVMKKCVPFRIVNRLPKGNPELFDFAEAAASSYDSMVRARGRGGRLNFRTALDQSEFGLKHAA